MMTVRLGDSLTPIPQLSNCNIYANISSDYSSITRSLRLYNRLKYKYKIVSIGLNEKYSVRQRSLEDHFNDDFWNIMTDWDSAYPMP